MQGEKVEKHSVPVQSNTLVKQSYFGKFESKENGFLLRNKSPLA